MGKKVLAELINKEELNKDIYKFSVRSKEIADLAKPGQFLDIKVSDKGEPFLRRPISIHNVDKENGIVEFIFMVVGKGTKILAGRNVGEKLDILGPLGNGTFDTDTKYNSVSIIGGGLGVFPLYELTKKLKNNASLNVYLGFRNKDLVTCEKEFEAIGLNKLCVTTDDGSYKEKGFAIDFMKKDIEEHRVDKIFACGPLPMLRAVKEYADKEGIDCELSMEERMGCGIGACLGCAIEYIRDDGTKTYKHVCKDGPVFESKKIIF